MHMADTWLSRMHAYMDCQAYLTRALRPILAWLEKEAHLHLLTCMAISLSLIVLPKCHDALSGGNVDIIMPEQHASTSVTIR